jgi:integrase/recombinase XerC
MVAEASNALSRPRVDVESTYDTVLSGCSENTKRAYAAAYRDFSTVIFNAGPQDGIRLLLSLTHGEANSVVAAYRAKMIEKDLAAKTINMRLSAIRSFVREANRFGLVPWMLAVKSVKSKKYRDTAGPGHGKYLAMLAKVLERIENKNGFDAKGRRDMAILRLLYNPALRRMEVGNLNREDVDFDAGTLRITMKGNTESQLIKPPPKAMDSIRDWLTHRGDAPGPLFMNLDPVAQNADRRLSDNSIGRVVNHYGKKLGLIVSPHRLRHGGATRVAQVTNGNAMAVKAFGRWEQLETAKIYIDNDQNLAAQAARLAEED